MIVENENQQRMSLSEIKSIVELVTNGKCVVETRTTNTHSITVFHVHSLLFENPKYSDSQTRSDEVTRWLRHEIQRRGYRIVHSNSTVTHVEAYPTCSYERDHNVQRIFKQHANQQNWSNLPWSSNPRDCSSRYIRLFKQWCRTPVSNQSALQLVYGWKIRGYMNECTVQWSNTVARFVLFS